MPIMSFLYKRWKISQKCSLPSATTTRSHDDEPNLALKIIVFFDSTAYCFKRCKLVTSSEKYYKPAERIGRGRLFWAGVI